MIVGSLDPPWGKGPLRVVNPQAVRVNSCVRGWGTKCHLRGCRRCPAAPAQVTLLIASVTSVSGVNAGPREGPGQAGLCGPWGEGGNERAVMGHGLSPSGEAPRRDLKKRPLGAQVEKPRGQGENRGVEGGEGVCGERRGERITREKGDRQR